MRLGLVGLPKSGKTTLFNLLTSSDVATDKFQQSTEAHVAATRVPDPRLERLRQLFEREKCTPATIEFIDLPGVERGAGTAALDLPRLREVDALVHVVRAFDDPEILHPDGAVDPERDAVAFDLELILADHELVERRLEKLAQAEKRGLTDAEKRERELLRETVLPALAAERPLREVDLAADDARRLRGFQLLSAKPVLRVWNVGEEGLGAVAPSAGGAGADAVVMSLPIEAEIARLEPGEQREFLAELGLDEPSLERAIRGSYRLLGLISFFTVGPDEVRAWTIRRGTAARAAAGAVHSDMERGFIRAEVVPWDELVARGSLAACREAGTLRVEGKDYVVEDGEVVHFRFNV